MSQSYWRRLVSLIALALALVASLAVPAAAGATYTPPGERTYLVTIENLTEGQPFTPPVLATHRNNTDVFSVGDAASTGIQGVAENGAVPGLVGVESVSRESSSNVTGPSLTSSTCMFAPNLPVATSMP